MKRKMSVHRDVVFMPAITPMEAAVIPAKPKKEPVGALAMARAMFDFDARAQRQKIWVR